MIMKALQFLNAGQPLQMAEVPKPSAYPGGLVFKVRACGICGSDLHAVEVPGLLQSGNVLGHEYAGEVVEVGPGCDDWKVGDRLVALPAKPCGTCPQCQAGRHAECSQIIMQGFDMRMPGAYAEYSTCMAGLAIKISDVLSDNDAPGLAECLSASTAIVALVQDVGPSTQDRNAFQELDQLELFKGVSKWVRRVTSADRIEDYVDMAFTAAASGRPGPAVLPVSMELLAERDERPVAMRKAHLGRDPMDRSQPEQAQIALAAELLANANAPIVYAGGGVIGSGAQEELRELQEIAHLPVATSTMGKGSVDETHPLSMGVIGYFMATRGMAKFVKPMVTGADVVLLIGNRTNQNGTDSWKLLPREAAYIHIDIDPMEISRNYEALRLNGDARLTLSALNSAMAAQDLSKRLSARAAVVSTIATARLRHQEEIAGVAQSEAAPIRPERFMAELEKQLAEDHIVVAVMNNGVLGYQKHAEDAGLGRHTNVCDFAPVDHAAIAEACGVKGIRLERAQDIATAIREALAADTTVLIDILADPNAMPPVSAFASLPNY
jgi:thiamine pyrophosphate-dependent acetolactate synthase large subunit-like protein